MTLAGSTPSAKGPEDYFTGTVRLDKLFAAEEPMTAEALSTHLGGADVRDLRNRLALDSGYMSRLLRSLEKQGLISLTRDVQDARARRVELTGAGRGEWQSYDIIFEAPEFAEDGTVTKPAYVTVLHNGILVHHHFELLGDTAWDSPPSYKKHEARLPIHIQDHGNPVRFRNIWIRENVQPLVGTPPAE